MLVPAHLSIQGLPTLVLFAGGRPIGRLVGPHPGRLQQCIEGLLAEVSAEVTHTMHNELLSRNEGE